MLKVELISTGDEVITGMIDDTNASWLCQELLALGIQVQRRSTIGDNLDDLVNILKERSQQCDLIFFNGGLGPTTDDCTTEAVCRTLNTKSVLLESWLEHIKAWHKSHNRTMPSSNIKQAYIPMGASFIDNPCGTACGYMVKINKALCFFTPGVPSEFKEMYLKQIKPYLKSNIINDSLTKVKRLFTFGISESLLQDKISKLQMPKHIVIGYRSYYPTIEIKIIAHGASKEEFEKSITDIKNLCKNYIYSENSDDIQKQIKDLIQDSSICIFDNLSEGIIASQLNQKIHNLTFFGTAKTFNEEYKKLLKLDDYNYALILDKSSSDSKAKVFIFDNNLHKKRTFCVGINATIASRKKYAYALITQILFLQILNYQQIRIKPDNAELIEIKD